MLKEKAKEALYYSLGVLNYPALQRREFLMVLAMLRSGSTLLTHILNDSPHIEGIGETKTTYRSHRDLIRMIGKVRAMQWRYQMARDPNPRYILDKVVHTRLLPPEHSGLLADERFRVIFLVREPAGAAASMVRMIPNMDGRRALEFYIHRIQTLAKTAADLAPRKACFFLDHSQLVGCTRPVLDELQAYLELPEPLNEQYRVTSLTGRFGVGDKSPEIGAGRVLKPKQISSRPEVDLPAELLARARLTYEQCVATLEAICRHVDETECAPAQSAGKAAG
jgi:hypothetical protein